MTISEDRIFEIVDYALEFGDEEAINVFSINAESLNRYKREYKILNDVRYKKKKLISDLRESFSEDELKTILKSKSQSLEKSKKIKHDFSGEIITFAHITDTHIGSIFFNEQLLFDAFEEFEKQEVSFICHSGDVTEGLSSRPDHYLQCTHLGHERQRDYAVSLFDKYDKPIYAISGNHDRWYLKNAGANIVKDIDTHVQNFHFIGHDEGDLDINGVLLRLFHGEDGSSYATSYRIQKLIESFTGGEKPNVLMVGHTHKQNITFERNVYAISSGALSYQSSWMRSKKLACHTGFHIIKMCISNKEVKWIEPRWYPIYKPFKISLSIGE